MPDPASVRRIGLLKTAAIGDTLLLSGLIGDVRRTYPGATVILITGSDNRAVAGLLPDPPDEHVVISVSRPTAALAAVRRADLDILVDFGSWPRFDALLTVLSGARFRVGFETPGQFRHRGFDRAVRHSGEMHERENYVRLLEAIGVDAVSPPWITPAATPEEHRFPAPPYAVFHAWPGGERHELKEWRPDRWVELGAALSRRSWTIVLSGAPADRANSEMLTQRMLARGVPVTNAAGQFTLSELASLLARSEMVVSVNTGVAHLSGLVGARTVSLNGPTASLRWRPLGPRARAVTSSLPGCGYLNLGFEYAGQRQDCMDGISVDAVLGAIDELLVD